MTAFPCPILGGNVELTHEREGHIESEHPDLLPDFRERLVDAVSAPDRVFLSSRDPGALLFARRFAELGGKYIVAVVHRDPEGHRAWIVTAYITRRLPGELKEWHRN